MYKYKLSWKGRTIIRRSPIAYNFSVSKINNINISCMMELRLLYKCTQNQTQQQSIIMCNMVGQLLDGYFFIYSKFKVYVFVQVSLTRSYIPMKMLTLVGCSDIFIRRYYLGLLIVIPYKHNAFVLKTCFTSQVMLGLPMLEGTNPASCFPRCAIGYEAACYSRIWSEVSAIIFFSSFLILNASDNLLRHHTYFFLKYQRPNNARC